MGRWITCSGSWSFLLLHPFTGVEPAFLGPTRWGSFFLESLGARWIRGGSLGGALADGRGIHLGRSGFLGTEPGADLVAILCPLVGWNRDRNGTDPVSRFLHCRHQLVCAPARHRPCRPDSSGWIGFPHLCP